MEKYYEEDPEIRVWKIADVSWKILIFLRMLVYFSIRKWTEKNSTPLMFALLFKNFVNIKNFFKKKNYRNINNKIFSLNFYIFIIIYLLTRSFLVKNDLILYDNPIDDTIRRFFFFLY